MTNQEWIQTMSKERLAKHLYDITECDYCPARLNDCHISFKKCRDALEKWLEAEHEEG